MVDTIAFQVHELARPRGAFDRNSMPCGRSRSCACAWKSPSLFWGSDKCVLWRVKQISRSQWNGGFRADSGPSRGDPGTRAIRPIEASKFAICNGRFTSTPVISDAEPREIFAARPAPLRLRFNPMPTSPDVSRREPQLKCSYSPFASVEQPRASRRSLA